MGRTDTLRVVLILRLRRDKELRLTRAETKLDCERAPLDPESPQLFTQPDTFVSILWNTKFSFPPDYGVLRGQFFEPHKDLTAIA